jgi:putative transposase
MKKKRFIVGQSVRTLKQAEVGVPVAVVIRETGISKQIFYQWKAKLLVLRWLGSLHDQKRQLKTPDSLWLGRQRKTLSSNR